MKIILPGVVALKPFKVVCYNLTQEMVDWWVMMGAEAQEITDPYYSYRGGRKEDKHFRVRMPGLGSKWSHKFNDGSGTYLLHMQEQFAPEASMFILKWPENIINHSIEIPKYDFAE
jgi:hypothetical protein